MGTNKAKNPRWVQACLWARCMGLWRIRIKPPSPYPTVRKLIIEAGLIEEWNKRYPEWTIKEAV